MRFIEYAIGSALQGLGGTLMGQGLGRLAAALFTAAAGPEAAPVTGGCAGLAAGEIAAGAQLHVPASVIAADGMDRFSYSVGLLGDEHETTGDTCSRREYPGLEPSGMDGGMDGWDIPGSWAAWNGPYSWASALRQPRRSLLARVKVRSAE